MLIKNMEETIPGVSLNISNSESALSRANEEFSIRQVLFKNAVKALSFSEVTVDSVWAGGKRKLINASLKNFS